MKGMIKRDYLVGNGAAQNIELGWIPDYVRVINVTDGDLITEGYLGGGNQVVPFSGGGTTEVAVGDTITGATSGAKATILKVLEYSGTWAGGDAAGFFVVDVISGTFQSENVYVSSDSTSGTDDATVTANVTHSVSVGAAAATASGNAAITRYAGSAGSNSKGFTIGSTVAEEAKLLYYVAFRADD